MLFGAMPGSDTTQLQRWHEVAAATVTYAKHRDTNGVLMCLKHLNNIAQGWLLSIEVENQQLREGMRQE